jgi:hypothetical protein
MQAGAINRFTFRTGYKSQKKFQELSVQPLTKGMFVKKCFLTAVSELCLEKK